MKTRLVALVLLVVLPIVSVGEEAGVVRTNDVVFALLKPMLARRSYDPTNGLVSGGPRSITSQSVFFSPRRGLSADELKGCFDWYLANLTNSLRGTVVRSNPMAVAAIEQCRAMSYTNAIPALTQFVEGVGDPAQALALELLLEWKDLDSSTLTQVDRFLGDSSAAHFRDKIRLFEKFSHKVRESRDSYLFNDAVDVLYRNRASKYGSVIVDRTLVETKDGYSSSLVRYETACRVLANGGIGPSSVEYFSGVTNVLHALER